MMGLVVLQSEQVSVSMVFNCLHCGAPLLKSSDGVQIDDRRAIGVCADCAEMVSIRREEHPASTSGASGRGYSTSVDVDAFDPYGQPILSEVGV